MNQNLMNYDSNAPADGLHDTNMMENNMPPFNPTDFFRDMIFSTDFMAELDNNLASGYIDDIEDGNNAHEQANMADVTPIDQIINEEDAEMMAEETN